MSINNTYFTLADLKASAVAEGTAFLVQDSAVADGTFFWTLGNFTGQADDKNIIKANSTALTVGAWLRQGASSIRAQQAPSLQMLLNAQNVGTLYSSMFPTLKAALIAWAGAGGRLIIDQDHNESAAFSYSDAIFLAGESYWLEALGKRTVTYTGTAYVNEFWRFSSSGADMCVRGDLTIDCQSNAGTAWWFDCGAVIGAWRRNLSVHGVTVRNCKLKAQYSGGANGIRIYGGFDRVWLTDFRVENITREAGNGSAGSYGTAGLQIFGSINSQANARAIVLERFSIASIGSEDTPGTTAYTDMDGVLIFQYQVGDDRVQAPIVRDFRIENAAGRGVKRYATARGGVTENFLITNSVYPRTNGGIGVAHQDGSGVVRNGVISLSGDANLQPSIGVGMGPVYGDDNGGGVIENILIQDTTGTPMLAPISLFMPAQPTQQPQIDAHIRRYSVSHIRHTGTALQFLQIGQLGSKGDAHVTLRDIDCTITGAVAVTNDTLALLKVQAFNFHNRGPTVPVVKLQNGSLRILSWGDWWGDDATQGVARYVPVWRGNAGFTNGFRGPGGGCVDAPRQGESEVFGRTPLGKFTIAAGATLNLPPFGSYQDKGGDYALLVRRIDNAQPFILIESTSNQVSWTNCRPTSYPPGWTVLNTGTPSGGGTNIEIWKDSATQAPRITNNLANPIVVEVTFNPV